MIITTTNNVEGARIDEYLQFMDKVNIDRDAVTYAEDGSVVLNYLGE